MSVNDLLQSSDLIGSRAQLGELFQQTTQKAGHDLDTEKANHAATKAELTSAKAIVVTLQAANIQLQGKLTALETALKAAGVAITQAESK
jgi:hypothetical protein